MVVSKLLLDRFRLHSSLLLEFPKKTTIIVGLNASGKTSVIEALYVLATGNSFRAERIEEMVSFESEFGRIKGIVELHDEKTEADIMAALGADTEEKRERYDLEVLLTRGVVNGKKTPFRLFSVNDVRRQKRTATGILKVVAFRPEDMRLIEGSPSRRREFLDVPLCLLYPEYEHALTNYEQMLKRRNKLLEAVREHEQPRTVLQYWNMGVLKHGQVLHEYRRKFLQSFSSVSFPYYFSVEYEPSLMNEERQKEYLDREIIVGHSLIGPHKDDIVVRMRDERFAKEEVPVATYGSRGQQRLAVLWLKTCELAFITEQAHEYPVLLLDDILSELDMESQALVTQLLGHQQAIVTTIDPIAAEKIKQELGEDQVDIIAMKEPR